MEVREGGGGLHAPEGLHVPGGVAARAWGGVRAEVPAGAGLHVPEGGAARAPPSLRAQACAGEGRLLERMQDPQRFLGKGRF